MLAGRNATQLTPDPQKDREVKTFNRSFPLEVSP
jgi:hypothetical protein